MLYYMILYYHFFYYQHFIKSAGGALRLREAGAGLQRHGRAQASGVHKGGFSKGGFSNLCISLVQL